jgi:hypothetical protein
MNLRLERFQAAHYSEYASWFADAELNRLLGPMDEVWLNAVLSEPESQGMTWAVFRDAEFVAVVEAVYDPENVSSAAISGPAA